MKSQNRATMTSLFTTERLIIRPLVMEDSFPFHEMQSNPNVMKYTGDDIKTKKENDKNLADVIAFYAQKENDFWIWAIDRKLDGAFVGTCAIVKSNPKPDQPAEDEIGYRFLEKYWGIGFGSEITKGLIDFAFTQFGKNKLIAEVDELNLASVKILDKHMTLTEEYYNEKDQSNDRKYVIRKED